MGKFTFDISDDFVKQLGNLADVERISPMMIDEAIPILETNVIKEASKHKRTGDMVRSIKRTKAKLNKYGGHYACVRPTGKDRNGVRNMEKMVYMEYGARNSTAHPVLSKAINDSESAVLEKMQEVFNREVDK